MSVILNPEISKLDPESVCYLAYKELYNQFFNDQDKKSASVPHGIEEGDEISIRLHNTAYGFAYVIAAASDKSGSTPIGYLKLSGGSMTGKLYANNGFEAGVGNNRVLESFEAGGISGIRITGNLEVGATGLYIGGQQLLSYDPETGTAMLKSSKIQFGKASLLSEGELIIGTKTKGVYFSPTTALFNNNPFYHTGNANREDVNWQMKDASVTGSLNVKGAVTLSGTLNAINGVELGTDGVVRLYFNDDDIQANGFLSFASGFGIKINQMAVLISSGEKDIQLGGIGGDLLIGNDTTNKVKLLNNLTTFNGQSTLLTPYGGAYFPDSLTVHHNSGEKLFSSYRVSVSDEGMVVHKRLRLGTTLGSFLTGNKEGFSLTSYVEKVIPDTGKRITYTHQTSFSHQLSTSRFQPLNRDSVSMVFQTDADFFRFDQSVEVKNHIAIDDSFTRLMAGALFFTEGIYLLSVAGGIKHSGNAYFLSDLSSEYFASGYAGSGWMIGRNKTTGNTSATFDELTIRKKMRVYELEVQKISAVGGSLWVSDTCSGDQVIEL